MCKCENFEGLNYSNLESWYRRNTKIKIAIFKDVGKWFIETSEEKKVLSTLQINYCPLCGRKLT